MWKENKIYWNPLIMVDTTWGREGYLQLSISPQQNTSRCKGVVLSKVFCSNLLHVSNTLYSIWIMHWSLHDLLGHYQTRPPSMLYEKVSSKCDNFSFSTFLPLSTVLVVIVISSILFVQCSVTSDESKASNLARNNVVKEMEINQLTDVPKIKGFLDDDASMDKSLLANILPTP